MVVAGERVSHAGPGRAPVTDQIVKVAVSGFLFEQPVHHKLRGVDVNPTFFDHFEAALAVLSSAAGIEWVWPKSS
jgi:hypothetical protein